MQLKTISHIIKSKLEEWLLSITDEVLRKSVKNNILVSGGSITSMLLNEEVNDYDIYIIDRNVLLNLVKYYTKDIKEISIIDDKNKSSLVNNLNADYGVDQLEKINNAYATCLRNLKEDQIKLFISTGNGGLKVNTDKELDKLNYDPLFFSPNAISLSNKIQIVIRFHGNVQTIHKTFDFIHTTNYFTFSTGLVTNKEAIESILTKQLAYQGSHYPVTSIIRSKKFIKRGWNINAGELLKIMFEISQLDLSNPDVLDEQLIGVDVAYFEILIQALRAKFASDPNFKITAAYFNAIIDKVFNDSDNTIE